MRKLEVTSFGIFAAVLALNDNTVFWYLGISGVIITFILLIADELLGTFKR